MLAEVFSFQTFAVLFVFVRVGAALMLVPGFAAAQVSPRIRLIIALAISLLLTPVLSPLLPSLPASPIALFLLIAGEATVGFFLGALTRILLAAVHTAGTLISLFASLANAMVQDPVSDQQASTIAGFLSTTAVLLLFVTGQHLHVLEALVASYTLFPPDGWFEAQASLAAISTQLLEMAMLSAKLAGPFFVYAIVINLAMGIMNKMTPQLPIFFVSMPFVIAGGLLLLVFMVDDLLAVFLLVFGGWVKSI